MSIPRWAAILLAGGLAAIGTERPLGAQTPPMPTFPSQVELITVDAVVVDSSGRPVPGLTKDDFVIKDDGRVREISSFEAFVLEPSGVPVAPPAIATNEPAARAANGRAFTILVDDVRITPDRSEVARGAVAAFLERSVGEGDFVTLRSSSGDLSWTAHIPEGTEDLLAVASRIRGRAVEENGVDSMSQYEAFQIANREDLIGASNAPSGPSGTPGRGTAPAAPAPGSGIAGAGLGATKDRVKSRWVNARWCVPPFCDGLIRAKAAELDAHRRAQLGVTLQAIRRELRALGLERGRKSLLFLSDGFIEDYSSDLREVAADSRQANTAIYFLDLRGLVAKPGFGSASEYTPFALPDPREQAAMGFEASKLDSLGAQTLADVTGGFSIRNTNDLAAGMEKIAKESRVFYLLGFYPSEGKADRTWRKLSVEVKKPGLTVRARRGYTLQAEAAPPPPVQEGEPQPAADPVIARALDSAQEIPDIPLRAMAYVLEPRPKDTVHVIVAAEIDAGRLAVQREGNAAYAHLEVSVVTENRDTGRGFRHDDVVDLPLRPGEPAGWRAFTREFELPVGVSQVHVVVRDLTSGAMGSVSQRFEVPLPGQLHLSTPILTDHVEPATIPEARPQLALAVHRVFPPKGGLYVEFEVFGAGRDPSQDQPRVTAGLDLFAPNGHLVRKLDPTPVADDAAGRVVRQVGIALDGLEEGSYDLVLDVKDEVRGAGLKHRETFMLARDVRVETFTAEAAPITARPTPPPSAPTNVPPPAAVPPELVPVLERAGQYVVGYARAFSNVLADEAYRQQGHQGSEAGPLVVRNIRSGVLFITLPGALPWATFRDVFEVDGSTIHDRQERLAKLFQDAPATARIRAQAMLEESARFNLGPIHRTVNIPTLALLFLDPGNQGRFAFTKKGRRAIDGIDTLEIGFVERARPTLISDGAGHDVPAKGSVWIDPARGTVVQTDVDYDINPRDTYHRTRARIITTYRQEAKLGILVPESMKEAYQWPVVRHQAARVQTRGLNRMINAGEDQDDVVGMTAEAQYSGYRRFEVTTEEAVAPKQ